MTRAGAAPGREDQGLAARVLAEAGVSVSLLGRVTGIPVVLGAALVAIAIYVLYVLGALGHPPRDTEDPGLRILAALAAGLVFAFTYAQWQLGREESSFRDYYERLKAANEFLDEWGRESARRMDGSQSSGPAVMDHMQNMMAFTELDNLEYLLGKYRMGYVGLGLMGRAVRTFQARCTMDWFREKVRYWTSVEGVGYRPETVRAAAAIVADLDARRRA